MLLDFHFIMDEYFFWIFIIGIANKVLNFSRFWEMRFY